MRTHRKRAVLRCTTEGLPSETTFLGRWLLVGRVWVSERVSERAGADVGDVSSLLSARLARLVPDRPRCPGAYVCMYEESMGAANEGRTGSIVWKKEDLSASARPLGDRRVYAASDRAVRRATLPTQPFWACDIHCRENELRTMMMRRLCLCFRSYLPRAPPRGTRLVA
ncbi:uncharacterized protein K452DRAFT_165707 [Aplosporella prunicola CBS 121167]|uniref:Uncharacterized protein n=1 Tax=Aplosporella prunicola CBS 121167 TaxID=1176127 RepID=A0A6A6AZ03_9PEZI|nr:uncharacterized protein K452DRAFT_165707 [Aplosporella prunicola CBS 121167]KAF2135701.1 hypothetical protein K452DRAFT_165707 [Aplosporella prunicola CBS 121167]